MIKITDNNGSPKDLIKRFFGTIPIIKVYNSTSLIWSAIKELLQDYSFMYSQTGGGNLSVDVKKGNIVKIQGNTIAWNQMFKTTDGSSTNRGITFTRLNNVFSVSGSFDGSSANVSELFYFYCIDTHKYYVNIPNRVMADIILFNIGGNSSTFFGNSIKEIKTATTTKDNAYLMFRYTTPNVTLSGSTTINIFDLTLIYGAGNEPSTPEQFEADYLRWFGKPLTYEAYDEGSLRSVKMSGLKTVGFNQWDEDWELGSLNTNDGSNYPANDRIRSKNYIPVIADKTYYIKSSSSCYIFEYDENKNCIKTFKDSGSSIYHTKANAEFGLDANCRYIKFFLYTTTYNNDICINISNVNKNGTYEKYWSETRNIPVTTLTGKVNGQGESVVVFPDGMLSAGDVHDEIYKQGGKTYAVKRVGRVDLGSLDGNYKSVTSSYPNGYYSVAISNLSHKNYQDIKCGRYNYVSSGWAKDKVVRTSDVGSSSVYIIDSSITSKSAFETALSGVYLNYELATPIVYELDTNLNLKYKADRNGTEEVIPVSGEECVAPIFDVEYT